VALNAANGNNASSGDQIYDKAFTVGLSSALKTTIVTSDTFICAGSLARFACATTGVKTYDWRFPNGSPSISSDSTPSKL
jgi:hypothetical protein